MRRETKETVRNFNKKCRKAERQITELAEDEQHSTAFMYFLAARVGRSLRVITCQITGHNGRKPDVRL